MSTMSSLFTLVLFFPLRVCMRRCTSRLPLALANATASAAWVSLVNAINNANELIWSSALRRFKFFILAYRLATNLHLLQVL